MENGEKYTALLIFVLTSCLHLSPPFSNQRNHTLFLVIACRITDKLLLLFWTSRGKKDHRSKAIQSAMPGYVLDSLRVTNWRHGQDPTQNLTFAPKKPHHLEYFLINPFSYLFMQCQMRKMPAKFAKIGQEILKFINTILLHHIEFTFYLKHMCKNP